MDWPVSKSVLAAVEQEAENMLASAGIFSVTVHITVENGENKVNLFAEKDSDRKLAAEILGIQIPN